MRKIHELLNSKLKEKFGIPLNGFEGENFHFHSTLFQDKNIKDEHEILVKRLNEKIYVPFEINVNEIDFGISEKGTVGTFIEVDSLSLNQ